jgi:hypothetical protein
MVIAVEWVDLVKDGSSRRSKRSIYREREWKRCRKAREWELIDGPAG